MSGDANPTLKVSKLDAARRQLETLITLYFHHGDPVSIHTLAAAAYNVIRDVNEKRGGARMMVKDALFDHVKPEKRAEFHAIIHAAENFFKHADRDPEAVLDFNPSAWTETLIYDACSKYWELTGELPSSFQLYRGWYMATHAHLFDIPEDQKRLLGRATPITTQGRAGFFKEMLPLMMKQSVTGKQ